MEPLQVKRPATQTQRQTPKTTFGNPQPVPKVLATRPQTRPIIGITSRSRQIQDFTARPVHRLSVPNRAPIITVPSVPFSSAPSSVPAPAPNVMPNATPEAVSEVPVASTVPKVPIVVAVPQPSRRLPLDMNLPGAESPSGWRALIRQTKWRSVRRWTLRGVAVGLVVMITLGGLLVSQGYLKANKVFKGGAGTAAALKVNVDPNLLKGEGSGRVNILLLGRGGGTHDAPDLTDTMMVASIDPINHTSTLLSIPRDLWVTVPNAGVMKINAAWETGEFKYLGKTTTGSTDPKAIAAGFAMVDQSVGDVLGLTIDYNVLVDFQAFQQAVDTVGGINVNVPTDLVDPTMAWENGGNSILAKAGAQQFTGAQALLYVRSRETSSDFARGARQRTVLTALKNKVVSLGTLSDPLKISGLLNAFGNNVQTDLSLSNASRLYTILKSIDDTHTSSISLDDPTGQYVATGNINGQSIVLPKAGLFKYQAIQQFVRLQLPDPYLVQEQAKVLVLNGTAVSGLATTTADQLKTYGYNIVGEGNTPTSDWTQTQLVDLSHHKDKYTAHYLSERLGVTATTSLSDNTIQTNSADFVIILGSDETATSTTSQSSSHPTPTAAR